MRDLLPDEVLQRRHLLERILEVYERYGFQQIETPMVEDIDRLLGSEGGENEKLLYKVLKRGLDWPPPTEDEAIDLGLRYDLTVPLARFFATNSDRVLLPFKAIQTGPVFRAERPQKGRYRQFNQCDADVIGETSMSSEIESVCAAAEALRACGAGEIVVRMNDRRLLDSIVRATGFDAARVPSVLIALDKFDKLGAGGVRKELDALGNAVAADAMTSLLEALAEVRGFDATIALLPASVDEIALEDMRQISTGVTAALADLPIEFDPTLVRGQGYYTGAIFEIEHPASSGSLAGGGRYDRMIGKLSGRDVPACGMSIGFERLWDILGETLDLNAGLRRVVLLHARDANVADVMAAAQQLRREGTNIRCDVAVKNRSAQLSRFARAGFTHWAELIDGRATEPQSLVKEGQR